MRFPIVKTKEIVSIKIFGPLCLNADQLQPLKTLGCFSPH